MVRSLLWIFRDTGYCRSVPRFTERLLWRYSFLPLDYAASSGRWRARQTESVGYIDHALLGALDRRRAAGLVDRCDLDCRLSTTGYVPEVVSIAGALFARRAQGTR